MYKLFLSLLRITEWVAPFELYAWQEENGGKKVCMINDRLSASSRDHECMLYTEVSYN